MLHPVATPQRAVRALRRNRDSRKDPSSAHAPWMGAMAPHPCGTSAAAPCAHPGVGTRPSALPPRDCSVARSRSPVPSAELSAHASITATGATAARATSVPWWWSSKALCPVAMAPASPGRCQPGDPHRAQREQPGDLQCVPGIAVSFAWLHRDKGARHCHRRTGHHAAVTGARMSGGESHGARWAWLEQPTLGPALAPSIPLCAWAGGTAAPRSCRWQHVLQERSREASRPGRRRPARRPTHPGLQLAELWEQPCHLSQPHEEKETFACRKRRGR